MYYIKNKSNKEFKEHDMDKSNGNSNYDMQ